MFLQNRLDGYLELLYQMVAINSFTANPTGVNKLGSYTAEVFSEHGFQAEFFPSSLPQYGRHLFLRRPAKTLAGKMPTIALVSHLDTVFPPEEEHANDFAWRREGDRIFGPGTVDIKGGTLMIYMILDALRQHVPEEFDRINWIVALDAAEEVLSDEFGKLCLDQLPKDTLACLVFEGGTINDAAFPLVVARKGRATYRVSVEGRSAHAGSAHEQGANAVVQLAHAILEIAGFTDYTRQLTFNVGPVNGGVVVNRVPHFAEAEVEMRAFDPEVYASGMAKIMALKEVSTVASQGGYTCRVKVDLIDEMAPWGHNPQTKRLYDLWEQAAIKVGVKVIPEARGGLSDGNIFWSQFPTLDGLGPSGANAHCSEHSPDGSKEQEYLLVPSFIPKATMNTVAILDLITRHEPH